MTDLLAEQPSSTVGDTPLFVALNEAQCRAVEAVDGPVLVRQPMPYDVDIDVTA